MPEERGGRMYPFSNFPIAALRGSVLLEYSTRDSGLAPALGARWGLVFGETQPGGFAQASHTASAALH